MKAAFIVIVAVIALSQTAFCRPDTNVARPNSQHCVDNLIADLENHVEKLGDRIELFIFTTLAMRTLLDEARDFCDTLVTHDPPTWYEEILFDQCVKRHEGLVEDESQRVKDELRDIVKEQPELLGGYLIDFGLCLLPWTSRSAIPADN